MRHRLADHTYAFPRQKKSLYLHFHRFHEGRFDISVIFIEQTQHDLMRKLRETLWPGFPFQILSPPFP